MANLENSIVNNALAALSSGAPRHVMQAIKQASVKTGVNFAYLVQQAKAESSFNPNIKAKTSSATGLYQFIESTWLNMVEKHGETFGIDTKNKSRSELLELRKDPEAASFMAAKFASENEKFLKTHHGGEIGSTELYFAHFLGAPKAAAFLNAKEENPIQSAATLFPKAAKANRNVFYDTATGRAKSMQEVYNFFDKKFDGNTEAVQVAANDTPQQKVRPNAPYRSTSPPRNLNYINSYIGGNHDLALNILSHNRGHNESIVSPIMRNIAGQDFTRIPFQRLLGTPVELMLMAQLDSPLEAMMGNKTNDKNDTDSLF